MRDANGNTPLHLAACTSHFEVITLLLEAGSDPSSYDGLGKTPLSYAESHLKILRRGNYSAEELKEKIAKVCLKIIILKIIVTFF